MHAVCHRHHRTIISSTWIPIGLQYSIISTRCTWPLTRHRRAILTRSAPDPQSTHTHTANDFLSMKTEQHIIIIWAHPMYNVLLYEVPDWKAQKETLAICNDKYPLHCTHTHPGGRGFCLSRSQPDVVFWMHLGCACRASALYIIYRCILRMFLFADRIVDDAIALSTMQSHCGDLARY